MGLSNFLFELRDDQLHLTLLLKKLVNTFILVCDCLSPLLQALSNDLALSFHISCDLAVNSYL